MPENYLIGVDLGTSVVKATLFDTAGHALAATTREMHIHQPHPGWAEQRGEDFYGATLETIGEILSRSGIDPRHVAAVAFDGQMSGAIGIDHNWEEVTPWYPSSLDARYQPYAAHMRTVVGDLMLRQGGGLPFMGPRILWWREERPEMYRRLHKVLILAGYVSGRMAELPADEAFIDPSYLAWTGLADTAARTWSVEVCEAFNIPLNILPRIVPSTQVIGTLGQEAASICGLPTGLPLVAGAGDQVAGLVGAGVLEPGQGIDAAGTFSTLATCVDRFAPDTEVKALQCLAGPIPGLFYLLSYIPGGGLTHRWFREQFGVEEKRRAAEGDLSAYYLLDEAAAQVPPGCEGLIFVPHLIGRDCPSDPLVRGLWAGFTWTHSRAHFYRAILEAIAYDYRYALDVVADLFPEIRFREIRVVGGGAASALWNQIKADVTGVPYVRLNRDDVAALGCAIMAGQAVGLYPDLSTAAEQLTRPTDRFAPRPEHHQIYRNYVKIYAGLFDKVRSLYRELTEVAALTPPSLEGEEL